MIKVLHIVGTRPQIIKAAALSRQIRTNYSDDISEILVDTGQHYDRELSSLFYDELQIPEPHINLEVGSGSHAQQTAGILMGIEKVMMTEDTDCVVVYGDTNSTIASALAAAKLGLPIVHIESGLRSFTKNMPEEINRVITDHLATLLFAPTKTALENLKKEGVRTDNPSPYTPDNPGVFLCGDVMYDNCLYFEKIIEKRSDILSKFDLEKEKFLLVTIHRDLNTDDTKRLEAILYGLLRIAKEEKMKVILPMHPRTAGAMKKEVNRDLFTEAEKHLSLVNPVSYLEMLTLEKYASMILTDSGGVQKESHFFQKPCIVLRKETEWMEQVENGTTVLADADPDRIFSSYIFLSSDKELIFPNFYGDGNSAKFICEKIISNFHQFHH